ncbi:hypothetical protein GALL_238320 [mine drainage metagenome]|uniref:DUF4381 domain-containing protein n=1 Tax=mine drainage metagenome TaxID=410659 RepID=A0A1J5RXK3_9ZZZZ
MNPALSQLRDIHLPAPVSWWPPAPGWWLLAAILLLSALGLYGWQRRRRRNRWRRIALGELERLRALQTARQAQPEILLGELSILLRRSALSCFPREQVASLHGERWLAFLDRSLGEGAIFQSGDGHLLTIAPYLKNAAINESSLLALFALGERWLKKLPAGGAR